MTEIDRWIRSLTGFFLFQEILCHLLPGDSYRKYVRLFIGMVLLLVVWQPLTGKSGIESRMAGYYEKILRQYDWQELTAGVPGMGEDYQKRMVAAYEDEVGANVMRMAETLGYRPCGCRVTIGTEEGGERYGMVAAIRLELTAEPAAESSFWKSEPGGEEAGESTQPVSAQIEPVMVEPVEVGQAGRERQEAASQDGEGTKGVAGRGEESLQETANRESEASRPDLSLLREKLAVFYDLEEEHVEIQIAQGER